MGSLIIINQPSKWNFNIPGVSVVSPKEYLTNRNYLEDKNLKIFNLSKSYKYQSEGYYVSLLAIARGHKVIPGISTIQDLKSPAVLNIVNHEIDELIQKSLNKVEAGTYTLSIYFGKNLSKKNDRLSLQLFNLFKAPLLRAFFEYDSKQSKWILDQITPIPASDIPDDHKPYVEEFAKEFFTVRNFSPKPPKSANRPYSLAILVNPKETHPPSDDLAIRRFSKAAEKKGFGVHLITKDDYAKIPQYDALFIRETTAVNHYSFRFAQRAKAEGIVVIDDPDSIIRCSNKVYLAELLHSNNVPTPKTVLIHKHNLAEITATIQYPSILKEPDGAFSFGVIKVNDPQEMLAKATKMLEKSDLILVQEFTPTEFDWRVGIIDKRPLYISKYFMAKNHWQIYDHRKELSESYGDSLTLPLESAPPGLIRTALRASNLIGDGLYGVDLKQVGDQFYVIEVNDNPSIDSETEDSILKDSLYDEIMAVFLKRVIQKKSNG